MSSPEQKPGNDSRNEGETINSQLIPIDPSDKKSPDTTNDPNKQSVLPLPIQKFVRKNKASFDWLRSRQPSVVQTNRFLTKATAPHFELMNTQDMDDLFDCPVDHLPKNMFPIELGAVQQILILLEVVYDDEEIEKVGGLEISTPVLYAWLRILVKFVNRKTPTISDVRGIEGKTISILEVEGLASLAKHDKDTRFALCEVKKISGRGVLLGPPDAS